MLAEVSRADAVGARAADARPPDSRVHGHVRRGAVDTIDLLSKGV